MVRKKSSSLWRQTLFTNHRQNDTIYFTNPLIFRIKKEKRGQTMKCKNLCKNCGHKLYQEETGEWFHNTSNLTYSKECHPIINDKIIVCGCTKPEPTEGKEEKK